jgi:phosphoglycolate phosphatase-like HAD superfamily hydrolase
VSTKNDAPRPTVLLFDIDGTLVDTGGAGRMAMEAAFERVIRRPGRMEFPFGGMTDRAIVRQALGRAGVAAADADIDRVIAVYLELLSEQLPRSNRYRVLPGVEALLGALSVAGNCAVGLGTGNVRAGAELKLAHADLYRHFAFGGFGCDHEDRAALLAIGADRGAKALGTTRAACRVVVIGDTTRDIVAARKIGAECVAVATGGVSIEELTTANPDALFQDLTAKDAASVILMGIAE